MDQYTDNFILFEEPPKWEQIFLRGVCNNARQVLEAVIKPAKNQREREMNAAGHR
jgi:hypothetical protein